MPVNVRFKGGPLDEQYIELDHDKPRKWYIMCGMSFVHGVYELKYELIGGVYYFMSDSKGALIWKEEQ